MWPAKKMGLVHWDLSEFWGLAATVLHGHVCISFRCAMVRPGRDRLSGILETDETYIGGTESGKRGRGASGKSLVLVTVEDKGKHFGRIRLYRIADASSDSIMRAIKESIEPGSTVRTRLSKTFL